ncbi:MAG TPA: TraR/DksA family transcriptional regulator [Woeseiaceae bacterium]|jgi:DnaK suppressor protein|nr:TraR/DksA family transcriptional regulator [Woeseiaceae bacterium]
MDADRIRELESRLRQMREMIVSLDAVRRESAAVVELEQTRTGRLSRMDALQLQAMANAGRKRAAQELRRIDAALRRIEDGTYGACLACGGSIAGGRLEARPAATLCLACAEERER